MQHPLHVRSPQESPRNCNTAFLQPLKTASLLFRAEFRAELGPAQFFLRGRFRAAALIFQALIFSVVGAPEKAAHLTLGEGARGRPPHLLPLGLGRCPAVPGMKCARCSHAEPVPKVKTCAQNQFPVAIG